MKHIRLGSKGADVRTWQFFLIGQKLLDGRADGSFGPKTENATKAFQRAYRLVADGDVGDRTYAVAASLGLHRLQPVANAEAEVQDVPFPARPKFGPFTGNDQRMKAFGRFSWVRDPEPGNRENIKILGDWEDENIVRIEIPQLAKFDDIGTHRRFHKKVAPAVRAMWAEFEKEGLMDHILTYDGDFFPRLIRGSSTALSNHAFGTAFDINAEWNGLAKTPAKPGQKGSVYALVPIMHKHGFYWGGHFSRLDGMHVEASALFA